MKWLEVAQSAPLRGRICIPGSKNSSLASLSAACMAEEPIVLRNVPQIEDIRIVFSICRDIGIEIERKEDGSVYIDSSSIKHAELNISLTSKYRASYYFVGALLSKLGKVVIGYPGGDDFISRPIDQHIKGLKALGAKITFEDDHYVVEAKRLRGATIYFDMVTSGATINCMMAAALAEGQTILQNSARDPEVVDTANMLIQMGAHITGAGTDTIRIEGVTRLQGCDYSVIPDRLIGGSMLIAAGITGGRVTIDQVIPEHLETCLVKLEEIGMTFDVDENSITAMAPDSLKATRIRTAMYPGFATDLQQPISSLLLFASGKSIVTETVYPKRFAHLAELRKMGANIDFRSKSSTAFISGNQKLVGHPVYAHDVRAGTSLILAGLAAEGVTHIYGVEHIQRGFEDVIGLFSKLGAKLRFYESKHAKNEAADLLPSMEKGL